MSREKIQFPSADAYRHGLALLGDSVQVYIRNEKRLTVAAGEIPSRLHSGPAELGPRPVRMVATRPMSNGMKAADVPSVQQAPVRLWRKIRCRTFLALTFVGLLWSCSEGLDKTAIRLCKEKIETKLKSPASAQYPKVEVERDFITVKDGGVVFEISGKIDAANVYGTLLREDFACVVDLDTEGAPTVAAFLGGSAPYQTAGILVPLYKKYHSRKQQGIRETKRGDRGRRPPDVVSYDEFLQLSEGMSLKEMQRIIDHDGVASPEVKDLGQPYRWINYDGSSLTVYFEYGTAKLISDEGLW